MALLTQLIQLCRTNHSFSIHSLIQSGNSIAQCWLRKKVTPICAFMLIREKSNVFLTKLINKLRGDGAIFHSIEHLCELGTWKNIKCFFLSLISGLLARETTKSISDLIQILANLLSIDWTLAVVRKLFMACQIVSYPNFQEVNFRVFLLSMWKQFSMLWVSGIWAIPSAPFDWFVFRFWVSSL